MVSSKMIEKINEANSWFFKKIDNNDTALAQWTKKTRRKTQIAQLKAYSGNTAAKLTETRVIKEQCEQTGRPKGNAQIPKNTKPRKTES